MDNWLIWAVGIIFVLGIVAGYIKGFFRIGLSLVSIVITLVLVAYLSPYVGDALAKYTPVDDWIREKCMDTFTSFVTPDMLAGKDLSGTPLAELEGEELQNIGTLDLDSLGMKAKELFDIVGDLPLDWQIQQIENSEIPKFLKDKLLENNNNAIYEELGVTSFPEYVAAYIARMLIHVVTFLVTFLLAIIIVKALMAAVDIIGELPIIGTLNHLGGAVVGAGVALAVVWLVFLLITVTYTTEISTSCFVQIQQNEILTFLYNNNPLLGKLLAF